MSTSPGPDPGTNRTPDPPPATWWQSTTLAFAAASAVLWAVNGIGHLAIPGGNSALLVAGGLVGLWTVREVVIAARHGVGTAIQDADLPALIAALKELLAALQASDATPPGGTAPAAPAAPAALHESHVHAAVDRVLEHFEMRMAHETEQWKHRVELEAEAAARSERNLTSVLGPLIEALPVFLERVVGRNGHDERRETARGPAQPPASAGNGAVVVPFPGRARPPEPGPQAAAPDPAYKTDVQTTDPATPSAEPVAPMHVASPAPVAGDLSAPADPAPAAVPEPAPAGPGA